MDYSRREFLCTSCKATALLALSGLGIMNLESCSENSSPNPLTAPPFSELGTIQATAQSGVITLVINSSSPLAQVGSVTLVQYQNGPLLVAHTAQNTFVALTAICTHQGCTVAGYDPAAGVYVCPCHGSRYTTSGQVVQGPAPSSLTQYPTNFANGQLTIHVP